VHATCPAHFILIDLITVLLQVKRHDSSVGIALGYGLDDWGSRVRFPAGAGNFSLHHRVQNGAGSHTASYPMGTSSSFPGIKRPGREADHSLPSSAEVKECEGLYLHTLIHFMAWCLVKHRDNFYNFNTTSYEVHHCTVFSNFLTLSPQRPVFKKLT
jgi:hypothetical protein